MFESAKYTAGDNKATEKRLLEAAGEIFAEYGYRAATVRQICEKAGANIALGLIAHARSGDKGNHANIGVVETRIRGGTIIPPLDRKSLASPTSSTGCPASAL